MSNRIVQQITGETCEPCVAFHSGIDGSYWESDAVGYAHCERAALDWMELGHVVLSSVEDEPTQHFGSSCIVCGTPPYAGNVYDYTLTIFAR